MKRYLIYLLLLLSGITHLHDIDLTHPLKIAVPRGSAPYCFVNDQGIIEGFSADLIRQIMHELGYTYEVELYNRTDIDYKTMRRSMSCC